MDFPLSVSFHHCFILIHSPIQTLTWAPFNFLFSHMISFNACELTHQWVAFNKDVL